MTSAAPTAGILLYAHGSRDPGWALPFTRLREMLLEQAPGTPVELAFLEHTRPDLTEAVGRMAARGIERVTLVPLFLGVGGHVRRDLPEAVRVACAAHPGVVVRTTSTPGEMDAVLAGIARWAIAEHEWTRGAQLPGPLA